MPRESNFATSIASWSMAVAKAMDTYGIDSEQAFAEAGIDLRTAKSPYARFPVDGVQRVWRYAYDHTDAAFGFRVSQFLNTASFHALGLGMYTSSTLHEMLERLIRYRCVISHMFFAELVEQRGLCILSSTDERKIKTHITADALYCHIITLCRELYEPDFAPEKVTLVRTPRKPTTQLSEFIQAPIEFDAPANSICFSTASVSAPLPYADPPLAAKLDQITEQYIAEHGLISEYMLRVKNEIIKQLELGEVKVNTVAESLHVTVRTLQRRLKSENSSYNELLDSIRRDMAMCYVRDVSINATQLAFKLGFNDSRSFSKSFIRWTGQSFSEYLQQPADYK